MERLDGYEFKRRGKTGSRYDPILDGDIYRLTLDDYPNARSLHALRQTIKTTGARRGLKVHSRLEHFSDPPSLVVQAVPRPDGKRAAY